MCLKSKAELEICSSKIEKWIDCVGPWYHICWYMFAKYPPLWWWKNNKNKQCFFDSIPCLCSGAKSRFFMAKSVFFGWSNPSNPSFSGGTSRPKAPFRSRPAGHLPPFQALQDQCVAVDTDPPLALVSVWAKFSAMITILGKWTWRNQNHIMNHITSPSENKDTSTSTTIIRKALGQNRVWTRINYPELDC